MLRLSNSYKVQQLDVIFDIRHNLHLQIIHANYLLTLDMVRDMFELSYRVNFADVNYSTVL